MGKKEDEDFSDAIIRLTSTKLMDSRGEEKRRYVLQTTGDSWLKLIRSSAWEPRAV